MTGHADRQRSRRGAAQRSRHPFGQHRQLDTSGDATIPVLTTDSVLWKESSNIYSSGQLVRDRLPEGPTTELAFGTWSGILYPSAGHRFDTAWGVDSTQFYVLDLTTNQVVLLEGYPSTGPLNDVRPAVAGDLFVWSRGVSTLDAQGNPTQPPRVELGAASA